MPSLIEELQTGALDGTVSITDLLRKAKVTAVKLGRLDFAEWINKETSGYDKGDHIPQYRRLIGELKYYNPFRGWCPVIGTTPERICYQPISEVQTLLAGEDGFFVHGVSAEFARHLCEKLGFVADVKIHIPRAALAGIVEAVRDAVLDWALKLDQAGVRGEGISFSPAETDRARTVNITIGSIGNATGIGAFGDNATVTATQSLTSTDFARETLRLIEKLEQQLGGLPDGTREAAAPILAELRDAASADTPEPGAIRRGLESLKHVMEHAAGHVIATGALSLIAQLLHIAPAD